MKEDSGKGSRPGGERRPSKILGPGTEAPDFSLPTTPDQKVALSDLRGRPVVLAFYPADWSPVCGDELALFHEVLPEIRKHGAELLGVSVDGVWCHDAYSKARKLGFRLLSDFEPKGAIARRYGAYRDQDGVCERALFVVDAAGKIAWSYLSPIGLTPGADGILNALEQLDGRRDPGEKEEAA